MFLLKNYQNISKKLLKNAIGTVTSHAKKAGQFYLDSFKIYTLVFSLSLLNLLSKIMFKNDVG